MARMFPDPIPDYMDADESRGAELAVYEALRSSLSDQLRVFYRVSWLAPARSGGKPHDGEADFLIVHPEMGVLVLEVKGGVISRDGVSGRWTSLLNLMAVWNKRDCHDGAWGGVSGLFGDGGGAAGGTAAGDYGGFGRYGATGGAGGGDVPVLAGDGGADEAY